MAISDLTDWLDARSNPDAIWYAKRLAANDTLASNAHQAGPYIPKKVILNVFPGLITPLRKYDLHRESSGIPDVLAVEETLDHIGLPLATAQV